MRAFGAAIVLCAGCLDFTGVHCRTSADCISDGFCVAQKCEARGGRHVRVSIQAAPSVLIAGRTGQYAAAVTGVSEGRVIWSVQEPGGGSISQGGLYSAPSTQGTYHVVATPPGLTVPVKVTGCPKTENLLDEAIAVLVAIEGPLDVSATTIMLRTCVRSRASPALRGLA